MRLPVSAGSAIFEGWALISRSPIPNGHGLWAGTYEWLTNQPLTNSSSSCLLRQALWFLKVGFWLAGPLSPMGMVFRLGPWIDLPINQPNCVFSNFVAWQKEKPSKKEGKRIIYWRSFISEEHTCSSVFLFSHTFLTGKSTYFNFQSP